MSKVKCSAKNPATCRNHGYDVKMASLKEQQQEAIANNDPEAAYKATKAIEAVEAEAAKTKNVATISDLFDADGRTYISSMTRGVIVGFQAYPRIHSVNEKGNEVAYVRSLAYAHIEAPECLRLQASRPLSEEEVTNVERVVRSRYNQTLKGEGLVPSRRDGEASIIIRGDFTPFNRNSKDREEFETGLLAGKDANLIEGFGPDTTFTLYYEDSSIILRH
jgi:hypothetical protein